MLEDPGRDWGVSEVFIGSATMTAVDLLRTRDTSPVGAGRQRPDRAIYERAGVSRHPAGDGPGQPEAQRTVTRHVGWSGDPRTSSCLQLPRAGPVPDRRSV